MPVTDNLTKTLFPLLFDVFIQQGKKLIKKQCAAILEENTVTNLEGASSSNSSINEERSLLGIEITEEGVKAYRGKRERSPAFFGDKRLCNSNHSKLSRKPIPEAIVDFFNNAKPENHGYLFAQLMGLSDVEISVAYKDEPVIACLNQLLSQVDKYDIELFTETLKKYFLKGHLVRFQDLAFQISQVTAPLDSRTQAIMHCSASKAHILDFTFLLFGKVQMLALATILKSNSSIQRISFNMCRLDNECLTILLDSLSDNKTITMLGLSDNNIKDTDIVAILKHCVHLNDLDLSVNQISDEGAKLVLHAFAKQDVIPDIDLRFNKISTELLDQLTDKFNNQYHNALMKNSNLTRMLLTSILSEQESLLPLEPLPSLSEGPRI